MAALAVVKFRPGRDDVPVPRRPDLAGRLAEAEHAAVEPGRRVGELSATLDAALNRQDYAAAQSVKDELAEARQEAAIAEASVSALREALAEITRQRADDDRAIQVEQQKAAARQRLAEASRRDRELTAELDVEVDAVLVGLEAVKRTILYALQLERDAGDARAEAHQARVVMGEADAGFRPAAPNKMRAQLEYVPILQQVFRWSR